MPTIYAVDSKDILAYTDLNNSAINSQPSNGAKLIAANTDKLFAVLDGKPHSSMHFYPIFLDGKLGQPTPIDTSDAPLPDVSLAICCCSNQPNMIYVGGGARNVEIVSYQVDPVDANLVNFNPASPKTKLVCKGSASPTDLTGISSFHMSSVADQSGNQYLYALSTATGSSGGKARIQSSISSFNLPISGEINKIDESKMTCMLFSLTATSKFIYALGAPGTGDLLNPNDSG
ncbi:MAG: hypothetical protein QOI13_2166 [Paraburkholderia sp.]|jgi:hypothetical protein|nr:hypothetical protein [Paraburkholderia sp.]